MLYPDFDTAWADWTDRFYDSYQPEMADCFNFLTTAGVLGFTSGGYAALRNAVVQLQFAIRILIGDPVGSFDDPLLNNMLWYGAHGGIDMQQINDAMLDAEYLEISEYLSIQWAFQQSMWDQPFFADKYAAIINRIRT